MRPNAPGLAVHVSKYLSALPPSRLFLILIIRSTSTDPFITIHRTSGAHASPTAVDSPYDRLATVRAAHRCPWTSIRRTALHKAATNRPPGRPCLRGHVTSPSPSPTASWTSRTVVETVRIITSHSCFFVQAFPKSRGYRPSQRFPGSALEPPSMHSHQRRDALVPRRSRPALKRTSTASMRDRTQPCANCRLSHRCFAPRIAHACSSPKRRPIPASPPASSKPSAARTVASLTMLSP
jgi:hypothetical protein